MGALMRLIRQARKSTRVALLAFLLVMGFCLPVWGAGTCNNFIAAGGFEYDEIKLVDVPRQWVQSSSNNYPPIYICGDPYDPYNPYDLCNETNNPNLARNGSGWAWFGGIPPEDPPVEILEVASLTQNITITVPLGGIVPLQLYLQTQKDLVPTANLDIDVIKVSMDCTIVTDEFSSEYGMILSEGTEVFSTRASNPDYWTGYIPVVLNLSNYADGHSHKLCFKSTTHSSTGFFVDDISRVDKQFVNISNTVNFADDLLQPIIDSTLSAQEIRAQAYDSREDIVVNLENTAAVLTLKGGFGCDFAEIIPGAKTTIRSLEIRSGKVIAQNLVLKGNL